MIRLLHLMLFFWGVYARLAQAQQDALFTTYRFNSLLFNPAYAGSHDHLAAYAVHRKQWSGFEGAPSTQALSVHTPLKGDRVGVGLFLSNDKQGAGKVFDFGLAYAYRIPIGESFKLSGGLQASLSNWRGEWQKLVLETADDPAFATPLNRWLPNAGAGLYLYNRYFYAGLACPRLFEFDLHESQASDRLTARNYRHYYAMIGTAFRWKGSDQLILRPSLLYRTIQPLGALRRQPYKNLGAPSQLDVDFSVFIGQLVWVGTSYRLTPQRSKSTDDAADIWVAVYLRNGIRLGGAYDLVVSPLRKTASGSFELLLGYEFDIKADRVASPRYF